MDKSKSKLEAYAWDNLRNDGTFMEGRIYRDSPNGGSLVLTEEYLFSKFKGYRVKARIKSEPKQTERS